MIEAMTGAACTLDKFDIFTKTFVENYFQTKEIYSIVRKQLL